MLYRDRDAHAKAFMHSLVDAFESAVQAPPPPVSLSTCAFSQPLPHLFLKLLVQILLVMPEETDKHSLFSLVPLRCHTRSATGNFSAASPSSKLMHATVTNDQSKRLQASLEMFYLHACISAITQIPQQHT